MTVMSFVLAGTLQAQEQKLDKNKGTFTCWFKPNWSFNADMKVKKPNHQLFVWIAEKNKNYINVFFYKENRLTIHTFSGGKAIFTGSKPLAAALKQGKWINIAATWSTQSGLQLFVNGKKVASRPKYIAPIGEAEYKLDPYKNANGVIKNSLVFNKVLSLEEIAKYAKTPPAEETEATSAQKKSDENSLLNNVKTLEVVKLDDQSNKKLEELKKELATLWDYKEIGNNPLDVEVISTVTNNGITTKGIYINGAVTPKGTDRVFMWYSRPDTLKGKLPVYIEITGGSRDVKKPQWMANTWKCAVIDIEWRSTKSPNRSKWAGGSTDLMKQMNSLKAALPYRLVTGIRRAIDYVEKQPKIDKNRIAVGGGSMGGYYTLLTAGVDSRVSFGMDALGGGRLDNPGSSLANFDMSPDFKKVWLQAFDPYSYAKSTKAKIIMNLSSDDYFFWLNDCIANYKLLPKGKRLSITPNFNHNDGSFGKKKNQAINFLRYCFGEWDKYPHVAETKYDGVTYSVTASEIQADAQAYLYWSAGADNLAWSSRYWQKIKAVKKGNSFEAKIPEKYRKLAHYAFMNVQDSHGLASSIPEYVQGVDPQKGDTLWNNEQLWDISEGISAWRPVGWAIHTRKTNPATHIKILADNAIELGPKAPQKNFAVVTNSFILASGQAQKHKGLELKIDGKGQAGTLDVILVRDYSSSATQKEFTAKVKYENGAKSYPLAWKDFKDNQGRSLVFPFDTIRIDGKREDSTPLVINEIKFLTEYLISN